MYLFDVIRRCAPGECDSNCNCDHITVNVDVDELTSAEAGYFLVRGTEAQRAEIVAYYSTEAA